MEQEFQFKEEPSVGITEFISQGRQLPALGKYLFSDFIVNQIDKAERLVALNKAPSLEDLPAGNPPPNFQLSTELIQKITEKLGLEVSKSLQQLYHQLQCGEKVPNWEVTIEKELTKDERKNIHDFVREELTLMESQVSEGSKIKLKYNKSLKKMDSRGRHKYIHFTLYKHGVDTFNALFRLSKVIGVSQKIFSTAGLKDKRGHTTQRVSMYNSDKSLLLRFYKEAHRNKEIWIEDFKEFQDDKVEIGGLSGNQFGLILRLMNSGDAEEVLKRVQSLKNKGMINYFGLQRFGQFTTKTYEIGILYARKQWKQLVESIVLSDCNNEQVNKMKREIYQSRKYFRAERGLHNKYKIEKMIFKGLNKWGQNYQNAFESLPRSIKTLYTHSLQSYIWNRLASKRIRELGLELKLGDIVGKRIEKVEVKVKEEPNQIQQQDLQAAEEEQDDQAFEAILVTPQNISQYSIADLILPLLGPQIKLHQGTWLHKNMASQLQSLKLTQEDFNHSSKVQNSKASWRKMLIRPQVLDSEIISHSSPKDELQCPFYTSGEKLEVAPGELRALRIVVRLPKSAYATMAIRQMFHTPSEFQVQRQMNTLYEQKYSKPE